MDSVSSPIGHGATGFRSGLRDWYQLAAESERQVQTFVEIRPGLIVSGPFVEDGAGWRVALARPRDGDGAALDIVAINTDTRRLSRAESAALALATEHSFFYDSTTELLYLRTTETDIPTYLNTATIVARVAILIGTDAVTLPIFGPNLLTNGDFEDSLVGWSTSGAVIVPTFAPDSAYCMWLFNSGVAATADQDVTTVAGETYCVDGAYIAGNATVRISDGGGASNIVDGTGRVYGAAAGQLLASTWATGASPLTPAEERVNRRRFCYYFVARTTSTRLRLRANAPGNARFDSIRFRRVHAWSRALPLLPSGGVPSIDDGRADQWWGPWRTGEGAFSINNDNGALEALMGRYEFAGAEVVFRHGGRFPENGEEITPDGMLAGFAGRIRNAALTERALQVLAEDTRGQAQALVLRKFSRSEFPDLDPRFDDAPRPLFLGSVGDVRPVRVGVDAQTELPIFEVCDLGDWSNGMAVSDATRPAQIWLYRDEDAASRGDAGLRSDVTDHFDASSFAAGKPRAVKCVKPVSLDGLFFSFDIGGGPTHEVLLTPSREETRFVVPDALGPANNFAPGGGASSVVDGIAARGDGKYAHSHSSIGSRRLELLLSLTDAAAVTSVELRAICWSAAVAEGTSFRFYFDPGATGTRYYSDWTVEDPDETPAEYRFSWNKHPATNAHLVQADIHGSAIGIEFDPTGVGGTTGLICEFAQPVIIFVSTSDFTASRPGVRSPSQLATLLSASMNAASGLTDVSVEFQEDPTHENAWKFSVSSASALNLHTQTGRDPNGWTALRFPTDANMTGLGPVMHVAAEPYYTLQDDLDTATLSANFIGPADNSNGTYTGIAGAPIERGADVIRWLLCERLRVPRTAAPASAFATVRNARGGAMSIAITSAETEFGSVVAQIEAADRADLILDGEDYRYAARTTALPEAAALIYDREIESVKTAVSTADVASVVRVSYAPGAQVGRGAASLVEASVPGVRALYGHAEPLELVCAAASADDAEALRDDVALEVARARRRVTVTGFGDLAGLRVGQAFGLRATAGVVADATGSRDVDLRVVQRRLSGESLLATIEAVELPLAPTVPIATGARVKRDDDAAILLLLEV